MLALRSSLLIAAISLTNPGSVSRLAVAAPSVVEIDAPAQAALRGVLGRGRLPAETVVAVRSRGSSAETMELAMMAMSELDGIPGADVTFATLARVDDEMFRAMIAHLQVIRRLNQLVGVASLRVDLEHGIVDAVLKNGTRVAAVELLSGDDSGLGIGGHLNRIRIRTAAKALKAHGLSQRHLIVTTGGNYTATAAWAAQQPNMPVVVDGDQLALHGSGDADIAELYARKARRLEEPPPAADAVEQEIRELCAEASPLVRRALLDNPELVTELRRLLMAGRLEWAPLRQLVIHDPSAARMRELIGALQVLDSVPGVERAVEQLTLSNDHRYVAGHHNQLLRAADLHHEVGLAAVGLPLRNQSLDIDALGRDGTIYELKLLGRDPQRNLDSVRRGHKELARQRAALQVLDGEALLGPGVKPGQQLVLLTQRPLTPREAHEAEASALRHHIHPTYLTPSGGVAALRPNLPAPTRKPLRARGSLPQVHFRMAARRRAIH